MISINEKNRQKPNLFKQAENVLLLNDVDEKLILTRSIVKHWREGQLSRATEDAISAKHIAVPGRPEKPVLVNPRDLPKRGMKSAQDHAAFFHALAHIEFNAINLAWDAVYRFRDMPDDFYTEWMQVAEEEAFHFELLRDHLRSLNYDYGDFPGHNGLWEMAVRTEHDVMIRMALVPRVLEARGLDVTPGMIDKLRHHKQNTAAEILQIIYRDEIGHVEIGSRWFEYAAERQGLDADDMFKKLIESHARERIRPPLNDKARLKAGFSQQELDYLHGII